jgi:hypothetical protein
MCGPDRNSQRLRHANVNRHPVVPPAPSLPINSLNQFVRGHGMSVSERAACLELD